MLHVAERDAVSFPASLMFLFCCLRTTGADGFLYIRVLLQLFGQATHYKCYFVVWFPCLLEVIGSSVQVEIDAGLQPL